MIQSDGNTGDSFADSDEWIAAQCRQLFRAVRAEDSKAVEVCLFYLRNFLVKTLGSHLLRDLGWNSNERWLDGLGEAFPEIRLPVGLTLRDECIWATRDDQHWYSEPFQFEIDLDPADGSLRWYTF